MTAVADVVSYNEASNQDDLTSLPLAHLSVEVGHFYMDELLNGDEPIRARFAAVRPWLDAARASVRSTSRPRVSTCFLIDDYFYARTNPADIMPRLLAAAEASGVTIDYVAREAGCYEADNVDLAALTAARLVDEPAPKTNGSRPPTHQSGWLSNGARSSPDDGGQALRSRSWEPPQEFGRRNHSIFLDVELWRDERDRLWSCPFLAGIWHLLRLGVLRNFGEPVAQPQLCSPTQDWPSAWDDLPAVMQLREGADPFSAYHVLSILPRSYLPIEHAIQVILGQLDLEKPVVDDLVRRAARERITVPPAVTDRISHVFIDG
ncbi:SCO2522 family protein [Pseudofrankia sp. DC12]|uniref:SCO2522 family protein n=1 Tax=Pseudofrankia sp. DC12 TaxID=683315 RepID=UPI0009FFE930|nr:SCO2522 family protein [Pseudofrankia sp. DC12]